MIYSSSSFKLPFGIFFCGQVYWFLEMAHANEALKPGPLSSAGEIPHHAGSPQKTCLKSGHMTHITAY